MGRSKLLTEYLQSDTWVDFADSIDGTFLEAIDKPTWLLARLRSIPELYTYDATFVTDPRDRYQPDPYTGYPVDQYNPDTIKTVSDFMGLDNDLLLRELRFLGYTVHQSNLLSDPDLRADLYRVMDTIGQYYREKGSGRFIDWLSYILNTDLEAPILWTQDYVTFVEEGDPSIGTPVWNGGTWYPTSHVNLKYNYESWGAAAVELSFLSTIFKSLAPINLVLNQTVAKASGSAYLSASVFGTMLVVNQTPYVPPVVYPTFLSISGWAVAGFAIAGTELTVTTPAIAGKALAGPTICGTKIPGTAKCGYGFATAGKAVAANF